MCPQSSWTNRSLLTYCSTSSRDNLPLFGEIGFDRELARIDWQLELRPFFCPFWRHRVPPLGSHLLTPILDFRFAVEKLGCLAVTLMARNSALFVGCRFSLF